MFMNPKIYLYKMTTDCGGAPCVFRGLLSLAICKPEIRKGAREGDIIFGFGDKKKINDERMIYIARVTKKVPPGEYYRNPEYANRPDCIYYDEKGYAKRKPKAKFHKDTDEIPRDVGVRFERAYVLLSQDFRYFGKNGTTDYKQKFPLVKKLVENQRDGHRVNYTPETYKELTLLMEYAWKDFTDMENGRPTDPTSTCVCNG